MTRCKKQTIISVTGAADKPDDLVHDHLQSKRRGKMSYAALDCYRHLFYQKAPSRGKMNREMKLLLALIETSLVASGPTWLSGQEWDAWSAEEAEARRKAEEAEEAEEDEERWRVENAETQAVSSQQQEQEEHAAQEAETELPEADDHRRDAEQQGASSGRQGLRRGKRDDSPRCTGRSQGRHHCWHARG